MEALRLIGYWRDEQHPDYPRPDEYVDLEWDEDEREFLFSYLRRGVFVRGFMGHSRCRLCDKRDNGSAEISDGTYVWPEGLAHYVGEHRVRLPAEFVEHARSREQQLEEREVDLTWWLRRTKSEP